MSPCSRVGHIATTPPKSALIDLDESSGRRNRARIAEAWMDEYAKHFYTVLPNAMVSGQLLDCRPYEVGWEGGRGAFIYILKE